MTGDPVTGNAEAGNAEAGNAETGNPPVGNLGTIALIGPPASGKSRVGRRLAVRLGLEYIDTDKLIVAGHGAISDIFADYGEEHFRALERAEVRDALRQDAVVSLGGGAVLDPETQTDLAQARVVLLTISAEAAAKRINNDKRPLVRGIDTWRELVAARMDVYLSLAGYTADTSTRPIPDIVEEVAEWVESQGPGVARGPSTETEDAR